jgi:ribosomal protein S18 acetylase RimI-like enzyme
MWYLEVIAVHPSLQARGIGGGVMNSILEHVKNQPIYLECTRQENIGFYESFGFQVVDEVELVDEEQNLKFWAMVRPGKASCSE